MTPTPAALPQAELAVATSGPSRQIQKAATHGEAAKPRLKFLYVNAVPNAQRIRLEIEDEETEVALKVDLPGGSVSFNVPDNWLQPGTEYVLDIKAIADNGNQTVTDLRFTTEE